MKKKGFSFTRMAFRNVIRMPARSILYFVILTVLVATVFLGTFLLRATDNALLYLYDHYELYASITSRVEADASGRIVFANDSLQVKDVEMIVSSPLVSDYTQVIICGARVMSRVAIDQTDLYWSNDRILQVRPVRDLSIMREHKNGKMVLVQGRYFEGGNEIVIPEGFCEKNGISLGDTVTVRFSGSDISFDKRYYGEFTVVGIYGGETYEYEPFAFISSEYYCHLLAEGTGNADIALSQSYNRLDAILETPDSADAFMKYLEENGFAFSRFQVVFNDAAYNSAKAEIESVKDIVVIVFVTVVTVCVGLTLFFSAYFVNSRSDERATMHALGLKKRSVNAIFVLELVFVLFLSAAVGGLIGYGTSGAVVSAIETETKSSVSYDDDTGNNEASSVLTFVGTVSTPAEIKFLMSYTPAEQGENINKVYGKNAYVEEGEIKISDTLFDAIGGEYRIVGCAVGTGQTLEKADIKNGMVIDCVVPDNGRYNVGDRIELRLLPPESVLCLDYPYKYYVSKFSVTFNVVGYGGEGDICIPFDNMLAFERYLTGSPFDS